MTPLKEQLEEARAEHEEVSSLLKQLAAVAPEDAGYGITFTKLIDAVRQHVKEEEGEMFPAAREVLGAARLEELGREMAEMKPQLASVPAPHGLGWTTLKMKRSSPAVIGRLVDEPP